MKEKYKEITLEEAVRMLTAEENRKHVYAITELTPYDYITALGSAVKLLTDDEEEPNGK